jgi:multidrug efflux pump subunit AcrA (membrane-fusion protein)
MKRKRIVAAMVVAVVGGGWWWHSAHAVKGDAVQTQKIVTVERGEVKQVVLASGKISANNEVDIKCKASGEVIKLPFDESDPVTKGATVMELDPVDEQRAVDQAKSALTAAQCRVTTAKDTLAIAEQTQVTDTLQAQSTEKSAEINAADMRAKAQRTQKLFEAKQESEEQRESDEAVAKRAELAVDDAKTAIEALKTRPITIDMDRNMVTQAELDVETAKNTLADAEQRLKETTVVSPIDGVVTTRPAQIGTIVSSGITNYGGGTSIMTVCDLSRLFVLAPVDEADIGKVKREQPVTISCDAYPEKKFEGRILRIAAKGTNVQNVVTFDVKIEVLGEGKELLKPEMSTDVEIVVADREKVLRLPSEAVRTREKDKQRYVLVPVESGAMTQAVTASEASAAPAAAKKIATVERDVVVGVEDGKYSEILSGLHEKDKVVLDTVDDSQWSKLKSRDDSED